MQEKTRSLSQFIKKVLNIRSSKQAPPSPVDTISSTWYHHISELPLRNFIEVMVNSNLAALITFGSPSQNTLLFAWQDICNQFEDAMGNSEHKVFLILYKEVSLLSATYEQIQFLIKTLLLLNDKGIYSPYFYAELNKHLKTSFAFSKENKEQNAELLKRCYNRSKGIKLQLDLKQTQLNALNGKHVEGKKQTKEYYYSILITLSDHAKYPVTDAITTFEYCERVKRFNQYYEQVKSKSNGRK
jgi:hypothetical protein